MTTNTNTTKTDMYYDCTVDELCDILQKTKKYDDIIDMKIEPIVIECQYFDDTTGTKYINMCKYNISITRRIDNEQNNN